MQIINNGKNRVDCLAKNCPTVSARRGDGVDKNVKAFLCLFENIPICFMTNFFSLDIMVN